MRKFSLLAFALLLASQVQAQFIVNSNGIDLVSNTTLSTNGDWQNTGVFLNNGILILKDNWTNQGTYQAGTGKIVLDYGVNRTFNHNGQAVFKLEKTGIAAATLAGNVQVFDSLLLNNGFINTGTDTLILASTATPAQANVSHVVGRLTHLGGGNKYFPVGDGSNAYPVSLSQISGAAPKVTASVEAFPAGYSPGPGVDSLVANFPVAWRINASAQTDTASYITFQYPENATFPASVVAARAIAGNRLEGMGKRNISTNSGATKLTSYSKGLKGLFTIANGFGGNFKTDSLALVAFYNATGASAWSKRTNWLTGNVDVWQGITVTGDAITGIALNTANITGAMPDEVGDILSLTSVNVADNNLTYLPDFSDLTALTSLNVSANNLDFASLEYNAGITGINYANQKVIGQVDDLSAPVGSSITMNNTVGGTQNVYRWFRNGTLVADSVRSQYVIASVNRSNMGTFYTEITNPLVPGLTLTTAVDPAFATANIAGSFFAQNAVPATNGEVVLFRINPAGAYERLQAANVNNGAYTFSNVILDDYILFAEANAATHPTALPTYYANTIFWEEATPIILNQNESGLNIIAAQTPGASTGPGILGGFLEEDDGTTRIERTRRVGDAGVTARRSVGTGRGQEVVYVLVAYTETDENGNFEFNNLPQGDYRLNIQYPGYPMDSTSFIEFKIGAGLEAEVQVAASVLDGKINVRKRIVTGIFEAEAYRAAVFPNPAVESIQMQFENYAEDRELIFVDVRGQQVLQYAAPNKEVSVDVKHLKTGTYLIQIREGDGLKKVVRLVIE